MAHQWLEYSLIVECAMAVLVVLLMVHRSASSVFPWLARLVQADLITGLLALVFICFHDVFHLDSRHSYFIWFVSGWVLGVITLVLRVLVVYGVFAEAMRPLAGLHEAGKIVFRWVGLVSLVVALALLAGPGAFSGFEAITTTLSRLQQGFSVLTLCLLLFVCFAIRPLGLTFRSHLFGVSLGLGVAAMVELIEAAWAVTAGAQSLFSPIYVFASVGFCVALVIWGTYFALPEPPRKMILLPTTSPFFFWNRISEILGDAPGHVAVAGFTPDMLAPAEIEMLTAATSLQNATEEGEEGEAEEHPVSADTMRVTPLPPALRESLRRELGMPELISPVEPSLAL